MRLKLDRPRRPAAGLPRDGTPLPSRGRDVTAEHLEDKGAGPAQSHQAWPVIVDSFTRSRHWHIAARLRV